jgi:dTDP-4-dehydrorhamnose reductase
VTVDRRPGAPLLVVGASGYLGRRVVALAPAGAEVVATFHRNAPAGAAPHERHSWRALDVRDHAAIDALVADVQPSAIVNCAYVQHGADLDAITASAPGVLASAARQVGARFVHLSSDVVFAGRDDRPYDERDEPEPVHDYGRAKRRAEQAVRVANDAALIVRTSLIYRGSADTVEGPQERMVRAAVDDNAGISFFTDEVRNPIAVDTLAAALHELVTAADRGVLHVAGADAVDRLTFARLLAGPLGVDASALRGRPRDPALGPRPGNLSLDCGRARARLRTPLPGGRAVLSRREPRSDRDW